MATSTCIGSALVAASLLLFLQAKIGLAVGPDYSMLSFDVSVGRWGMPKRDIGLTAGLAPFKIFGKRGGGENKLDDGNTGLTAGSAPFKIFGKRPWPSNMGQLGQNQKGD